MTLLKDMRVLLSAFHLLIGASLVFCDENEYRLVRDLMKNYNKQVRPSSNFSEPLNVTFGVALAQIIDVDEKDQIITTNCWINQNWIDYKLQWDPIKYGNVSVIRLPFNDIWRPDILLYNNADVKAFESSISTNVIVTSEGNVTWLSMVIFKSSCSIDVKFFPFDEQNCSMQFASWTYDAYQVNVLTNGEDDGDVSNYIENSEWSLTGFQQKRHVVHFSCCEEPYIIIHYHILIKRRPLFYLFNMVMPCILITLVALLGFYMPSDSGEKISMGITTLLSMTVFLMIVAEKMPPTSDVLPLIGLYYGITIAIVSFATGMTVLTLNIHHKGTRGYEVPMILKKICFGVVAKILFIKLEVPLGSKDSMPAAPVADYYRRFDTDKLPENGRLSPRFIRKLNPSASASASETFERQFMRVLQKVYQTIERNEMRLAEQDRRDLIKQEWQQLALIIDRVLLLIFLGLTITVTLTVFFQGP